MENPLPGDKKRMTREPWFGRVLPFAVYMAFILVHDLLLKILPDSPIKFHLTAFTYPLKIIAVIAALMFYRKTYDELKRNAVRFGDIALSIVAGLLVFVLWIHMDQDFAVIGKQQASYDPRSLPEIWFYLFIFVRIFGASVVVPVFEEIFWRSFILRYIIHPDFMTVRIGTFTWSSFIVSSLLFGAEHHLWLAGIMAGILYNLLLYRTRSIRLCILAHGITNFLLGLYVLYSGEWKFW